MFVQLNDVFSNWKNGQGIFSYISTVPNYTPPWSEQIEADNLDLQYHGNNSGRKIISPLLASLISNNVLNDTDADIIATTISRLYSKKWLKLWNTFLLEYDPISNYDMSEKEETSTSNTGTVENTLNNTINNSRTTSETETPNLIGDISDTGSNSDKQSLYGFNSSSAVPANENAGTNTNTRKETQTGTIERNGTQIDTDTNNQTGKRTDNLSRSENRTLTRKGNIGVTTSQQMITAERDVWIWDYFKIVFEDVDKVLTIPIY